MKKQLSPDRIIELAEEARKQRQKNAVTHFCRQLCREFGVTDDEISSTALEPGFIEDEAQLFPKRIVKAGFAALRRAVTVLAIKKGIINLQEPMPTSLGRWGGGRKVLKVGLLGHIVVYNHGTPRRTSTALDPLNSEKFLALLKASVQPTPYVLSTSKPVMTPHFESGFD